MTEGQKLSVLVVDDARGIAEIYGRWLGDDYHVQTATDGQTALSVVDDAVDVVLIDRELPKMSGSTVVEEIRNLGHDPAVILLSSVEPDFDVIDVQFQECLTKPVMRRELVDAVDRAGSGEFPDRSNPTVSGPKLDDHSENGDDGEPATTPETDDDGTGATGDEADAESDGDDEDITSRLQSLQRDLDETASKLSERAQARSQGVAERSADDDEADEDDGSIDERDAEARDAGEPTDEGAIGGERDPGGPADEGATEWEPATVSEDGDDSGDESEPPSGGEPDATPAGSEGEAGDQEETLQQRVERLASRAQDLAEGDAEARDEDAS